MTKTPLSDLISVVLRDESEEAVNRFHKGFLRARVGVEVNNLPAIAQPGQRIDASGATIQLVTTPHGRAMVRASADPAEFVRNFPDRQITGLMTGAEILAMLLKVPEWDGVLVCSATSFHSIPIDRTQAARLLRRSKRIPATKLIALLQSRWFQAGVIALMLTILLLLPPEAREAVTIALLSLVNPGAGVR